MEHFRFSLQPPRTEARRGDARRGQARQGTWPLEARGGAEQASSSHGFSLPPEEKKKQLGWRHDRRDSGSSSRTRSIVHRWPRHRERERERERRMARTKQTANTPFGERQKEWSCRWKREYARYSHELRGIEMEWRRNPPPQMREDQREFKAYVFCNYGNYHYYEQVS